MIPSYLFSCISKAPSSQTIAGETDLSL